MLILRHKLKADIKVRRAYDPNLPQIDAHGSELNQVWTNIIDNAADALHNGPDGAAPPGAMITLRTRQEGKWLIVTIEDNGAGIPADVLPRIFDAFYLSLIHICLCPMGAGASGRGLAAVLGHSRLGDAGRLPQPGGEHGGAVALAVAPPGPTR